MRTRYLLTIVLFLAFGVALFGQKAAPPPTDPGSRHGDTTDIGQKGLDVNRLQPRSGNYLTGKVIVKEGARDVATLWDPIPVSVTCDGQVRFTTTANAKGEFTLTSPPPPPGSPSTPSTPDTRHVRTAQFVGCTASAALAGFDSTTLRMVNREISDTPDIGVIELKAEAGQQALAANSASVSKDAMKAFEKARAEWLDNKMDRAQRDLEKAVQLSPQFAEAWYQLGKIQEGLNQPGAWDSFSKAVAADPQFAQAYDHLAALAALSRKWKELTDYSARALELNPRGTPQTFYYNALGNYNLQKADAAEASAFKGLALDPLHTQPNIEQLIAVILAGKGDNAGALQHLRNCLAYLPSGPNADIVKQQIAQLEQVAPASQ